MLSHDLLSLRVWLDAMRASPDAGQLFRQGSEALSRLLGNAIEKAEVLERTTVLQATLLTKAQFGAGNVVALPTIPRRVPLQGGDVA